MSKNNTIHLVYQQINCSKTASKPTSDLTHLVQKGISSGAAVTGTFDIVNVLPT